MNNILYDVLVRIIERGDNDVTNKIDIFYATNKLSEEEYTKLVEMLGK